MNEQLSTSGIVKRAHSGNKVTGMKITQSVFPDFVESHGDRAGGDDPAIVGGAAAFYQQTVTVITTDRGKTTGDKIVKRFGPPMPNGYRKALRLIKQAAEFKRPIFCFVNTAEAFSSKEVEENEQGGAIAQNILQMSQLAIPIITIIYGGGGSGEALTSACRDEVWMLEDSTYSILSPEGSASVMWKDSARADKAAELMQMVPQALSKQGIVEGIVLESEEHRKACRNIEQALLKRLNKLQELPPNQLLTNRKKRYRKF